MAQACATAHGDHVIVERTPVQGPVLSLEEIPEIPSELAGIWAYIMWESAGCPQRSQDAADREYREGIAELQQCLCRGKSLDELWQVRCPFGIHGHTAAQLSFHSCLQCLASALLGSMLGMLMNR